MPAAVATSSCPQTVSNYKYYILVLPYFFSIVRCAAIVYNAFVS